MNESTRQSILDAADKLFDRTRLFKLASAVPQTRSGKGLRFWQERMLAELSEYCGIDVTGKENFIAVFEGTKDLYAPPKPDNSAAGILESMRSTWSDVAAKERWTQWAARDLSKTGTLDSYVRCYRALAKFLVADQVIQLYMDLRDQSRRSESEWRADFLKYFKKTITDAELP